MRKFILSTLLLSLLSLSVGWTQDNFKGTVEYDIQIEGEQAAMLSSMMFQKMIFKIGEGRMMTYFEGGMMSGMMGKIVSSQNGEKNYIIRDSEGTVYVMDDEDLEEGAEATEGVEVIKEEGEEEIQGYTCQQYKIVTETEGQETIQYIWATKDLKMPNKKNEKLGMGNMFMNEIEGFPLKLVTVTPMGTSEMKIIMQANVIREEKIDKDFFDYPEGYEVKDYDPSIFQGGF